MSMLQDTTSEIRKTAHNLMPNVLLRHDLGEALRIYCEHINASNELTITLRLYGDLKQLDKSVELFLYRMSQELIQNIIKHANASQAVVELELRDDTMNIIVEDNGIGFEVNSSYSGFGLQNLQFRVQALQGTLSIESAKEIGTTIIIQFDLNKLSNFSA
jgi:signal transduction histidine kinase